MLIDEEPNLPRIDEIILMNQDVPESGQTPPGNFLVYPTILLRHPFRRLADNLEIPNHSVLNQRIGEESLAPTLGVLLDSFQPPEDLPQVDARIPFHSGRASLRILRRRSQ